MTSRASGTWLISFLNTGNLNCNLVQGTRDKSFDPRFFHQTIASRALIHRLKPFRIWLWIRGENWFGSWQNRLPGSQWDIKGELLCTSSPLIFMFSSNYLYVMFTYVFLWSPLKGMTVNNRSHWNNKSRFCGCIETAESYSVVLLKPQNQLPRRLMISNNYQKFHRKFEPNSKWL
jgi:hypothetical protein